MLGIPEGRWAEVATRGSSARSQGRAKAPTPGWDGVQSEERAGRGGSQGVCLRGGAGVVTRQSPPPRDPTQDDKEFAEGSAATLGRGYSCLTFCQQ